MTEQVRKEVRSYLVTASAPKLKQKPATTRPTVMPHRTYIEYGDRCIAPVQPATPGHGGEA